MQDKVFKQSNQSKNWKINQDMYSFEEDNRWDHTVKVLPKEMFLSWFSRLAKVNGSDTMLLFLKLATGKKNAKIENLLVDGLFIVEVYDSLDEYVTIPSCFVEIVNRGTFEDYWDYLNEFGAEIKYCPLCLKYDLIPYFRTSWQFKAICICVNHQVILLDKCQDCFQPVKYWQNRYNEPIEICYNCGNDLSNYTIEPYPVTDTIMVFQNRLLDIYLKDEYKSENLEITGVGFFQQLWKIIVNETNITSIKNGNVKPELSLKQILSSVHQAMGLNDFDLRIKIPFRCSICNLPVETHDKLVIHREEHSMIKVKLQDLRYQQISGSQDHDKIAEFRYEVVRYLLNIERTDSIVREVAKSIGTSSKTVYRWMAKYRDHQTIESLKPKYHKRGRKGVYSSTIMKQWLDEYRNYAGKTMMAFYRIEFDKLQSKGYTKKEIPSYETLRRHLIRNELYEPDNS